MADQKSPDLFVPEATSNDAKVREDRDRIHDYGAPSQAQAKLDNKESPLPVFNCDCGWSGTEMEMVPEKTDEGVWDKCPGCGNCSDDMVQADD